MLRQHTTLDEALPGAEALSQLAQPVNHFPLLVGVLLRVERTVARILQWES